jgi:hypothetical protein
MPYSDRIPKSAMKTIEDRLDEIVAKWNEWNPLREVRR